MKSFKLSVYGNLILDEVLELDSFPVEGMASAYTRKRSALGASANVARAFNILTGEKALVVSRVNSQSVDDYTERLSGYSSPHFFTTDEEPSSSALILECRTNVTRTGIVNWGACTGLDVVSGGKPDWTHFCYLDKLPKITQEGLRKVEGIKSADLTSFDYSDSEKIRILNCLEEVDYLITSLEEASYLSGLEKVDEVLFVLGDRCKRGVVIHDPEGSYFCDGTSLKRVTAPHERLENISVLGAGDIFAAAFIASYSSCLTVGDCLLKSHIETYNILKENSNDKKI